MSLLISEIFIGLMYIFEKRYVWANLKVINLNNLYNL